jgi:hypothetical protein
MEIAMDINVSDGLIIIKAGKVIDAKLLDFLKKYNVHSVAVIESKEQIIIVSEDDKMKKHDEIKKNKEMLFKDCIDDEYMRELFKVVCDLKLSECLDG